METSWTVLLLVMLCAVLPALIKAQANPGVVVRLSQPALDYAGQQAVRLLSEHVQNGVSIRDESGTSGKTTYSLTNLAVKSFHPPGSTVSVSPGVGVDWSLRDADITIGGNWRYRYKRRIFKLSDHGSFTMSLSDVSISIRVSLGRGPDGQPTIGMLDCSSSVGRARARFSGSIVSWLYNLLYKLVEGKVRNLISDALCKAVRQTIEVDGTRELGNLQTEFRIRNMFLLDYSLVEDPVFGSGYIETSHRGQFRWIGDPSVPPSAPSPMPRHSSSMVAIYVSDYVIDTLAHVMHEHGQLSYTFTKTDLPAGSRDVLDMSCRLLCLGTVFRSAAASHPGSSAELRTSLVRPPTVQISHGTVQIRFEAEMRVAVRRPDGGHVDLAVVVFAGHVHGSAWIETDKIVGQVINATVAIVNTTVLTGDSSRTTIPEAMLGFLNSIIHIYSQTQIVPQLNHVAAIGFQLPKLRDISFIRPQLGLRDGFILVETDAAYKE